MSITDLTVRQGEVAPSEWDAYVATHPESTFFHQYHWLTLVRQTYGGVPHYLSAHRDGKVVGLLPLMQRHMIGAGRVFVGVPFADEGGLLADDEAAGDALLQNAQALASEARAGYLELRQKRPLGLAGECDLSRVVLARPLPSTSEMLWDELSKNMRKKVKRAARDGLTTTLGSPESVGVFHRIYAENMRDLGSPMHGLAFFQALFEHFPQQVLTLLVQTQEGEVAGASVAVQFREELTVLCAHSLRRHYHLFPNNQLYWSLLEAGIERGCRYANFGRSPRGTGIYEFKLLWGMEERQMYYEHLPICHQPSVRERRDSSAYRAFSGLWRHTPLPIATALGPRLFARLPI